jgi:hypothetical protein
MLIGSAFTAQAGIITAEQSASSNWVDTNFSQHKLNFDQFDTLGGTRTLTKIHFELFGETKKDFFAENTSTSSDSDFDVDLGTRLKLTTVVGLTELVTTLPRYISEFTLDVYDGQTDYLGASGLTAKGLYANKTEVKTITDQNLLGLFIGTGQVTTYLSGTSRDSITTSGGNITNNIKTQGAAKASVRYEYELKQVSTPASVGLFGLGLLCMSLRARRK